MLILFDNNVPRGLARGLAAHTVVEARERGWHLLKNGDLLKAAEDAGEEPLAQWTEKRDPSDEIEDMIQRAEFNPDAIVWGTFHRYRVDQA